MEKTLSKKRPEDYESLCSFIEHDLDQLYKHSIYHKLNDQTSIQKFMEIHGIAVWDFMNILSILRRKVVCTSLPWEPPKYPLLARFINQIFVAEETDQVENFQSISHFELYLKAMEELGADTKKVKDFIHLMSSDEGASIEDMQQIPLALIEFIQFGFDLIDYEIWEVVAAFLYGREKIIPIMFQKFLDTLNQSEKEEYKYFKLYLERHIELDGDEHGPMAEQMLKNVCGNDPQKWFLSAQMAKQAIQMRIKFWDLCEKTIKE